MRYREWLRVGFLELKATTSTWWDYPWHWYGGCCGNMDGDRTSRVTYDFFSGSCSPSFTADLKFLMPSPRPLPKSASLLGPKISRATARIRRISGKPNLPGM